MVWLDADRNLLKSDRRNSSAKSGRWKRRRNVKNAKPRPSSRTRTSLKSSTVRTFSPNSETKNPKRKEFPKANVVHAPQGAFPSKRANAASTRANGFQAREYRSSYPENRNRSLGAPA